jgi:diacylglycerol kinase (ATP)
MFFKNPPVELPKPYPDDRDLSGNQILIAYNPIAGPASSDRLKIIEKLQQHLQTAGFQVHLCSQAETLSELVAQYQAAGKLRGVIAAGGDGTIAFLLNRLPADVPIAVFPLGTENLLAKQLGYTQQPSYCLQLFTEGRIATFDAASANGRYFTLMASCGFDAEVVRQVHERRQGNIHRSTYFKQIWETMRAYTYPSMTVHWGESAAKTTQHTCCWAFISNFPLYAGGLRFSPQAHPADGTLDICLLTHGNFWPGMRYLYGVFTGQLSRMSDVVHARAKYVKIEAANSVPYQLDGDSGGLLPLEMECLPRRLSLIVPAEKGTT